MSYTIQTENGKELNRLYQDDTPIHNWYRFVLSFPPHLVRKYLEDFDLSGHHTILDPFCGTGTTLIECKKNGIKSLGMEVLPVAYLASKVKTNWSIDTDLFIDNSKIIFDKTNETILRSKDHLRTLDKEQEEILIKNSISPLPLHKALILLNTIKHFGKSNVMEHQLLAFAKQLVYSYSNLHFGPEVGVKRNKVIDIDVTDLWFKQIIAMKNDIKSYQSRSDITSQVFQFDSRKNPIFLDFKSIDAVITSPPYPNEKDYTRTTRLESVIMGYISNRQELRDFKHHLIRSNTRNVFKKDEDNQYINHNLKISRISEEIENRRKDLGKTSGFEKNYHKVVEQYFGGMYLHLKNLKPYLKPKAKLAYVVGDQASFFQVLIKTGEIIGELAEELNYHVEDIHVFRKRFSTKTKKYISENVVILSNE